MSNIWFTADTHFGHENIITFCDRPFRKADGRPDVGAMDKALIERWNERVKPNDMVYHLGDFAWRDHNWYRARLHGEIFLVPGNHDRLSQIDGLPNLIIEPDLMELRPPRGEKLPVVLCHYPMRNWNRAFHGSKHLYGHVHGAYPAQSNNLDVGVDCWDYRPVSWDEIKERMKEAGDARRGEGESPEPVSGQGGVRPVPDGREGSQAATGT